VVDVSTRLQADREPALPPQAAASLKQVPVPFAVPAGVWQEPDRRLGSRLAYGLRPWRFCQALKLRQDYGIRVRAIGRYSWPATAASPLPADGFVYRASRPHGKDAAATQRLVDTLFLWTLLNRRSVRLPLLSTQHSAFALRPQTRYPWPVTQDSSRPQHRCKWMN
jgi:hypothetical protein